MGPHYLDDDARKHHRARDAVEPHEGRDRGHYSYEDRGDLVERQVHDVDE